jgi:hypothetical protein
MWCGKGMKLVAVVDRCGVLVGVLTAPANLHVAQLAAPALANDGRRMRHYLRRYVVERTFGWLHSFHRVMVRQEWSHLHRGFVYMPVRLLHSGSFETGSNYLCVR